MIVALQLKFSDMLNGGCYRHTATLGVIWS